MHRSEMEVDRDGKSDRQRREEEEEMAQKGGFVHVSHLIPVELITQSLLLVDDMIEDCDPGAEHTWAETSNQHAAAGLYLDYGGQIGEYCFLHTWATRFTVGMETFLRCRARA